MIDGYITSNYCSFRAELSKDKVAVYDYDNKVNYTYGALDKRSNKLSHYLIDKFGIKKGDRIGFCARNSIEFLDAFYATAKIGAILVTFNCLLKEEELLKLVESEAPKVIFYEDIYKKTVNRLRQKVSVEHFIILTSNNNHEEDISYENIMEYEKESHMICESLSLEDIHMLIHTGGTTGTPKAAMISYRAILFNSLSEILTFGLNSSDSAYILLPFFHTGAWNAITLPLLFAGGKIIISKKFDPQTTLKIFAEEKPTVGLGVPTIFRMLINEPKFKEADLSSLKWMLTGAAPTPVDIMEKFWDKGVKFAAAYGMTEVGPNNLAFPMGEITIEEIKEKNRSVGKPMYFNEVKIVDEKGNEVPDGECGELIWRSKLTFSGYWNDEVETKNTIRNGWVFSGDIARKDEEGYYYIKGRNKNMYITGGENIFPIEIEEEIYKHPAVNEVCVIGILDNKWGEVGKAIISVKSNKNITNKELKKFLKGKIGSIKIPKYIEIVNELPKNDVGKIDIGLIEKLYR